MAVIFIAASTRAFADGEALYNTNCFACHDAGIAGAPKLGDTGNWTPRIATGIDAMVQNVIIGH